MHWKDTLLLKMLDNLPQREMSRAMGRLAARTLPHGMRRGVYEAFAKRYGLNLEEVELPLEEYTCFDDFFTRKLKPGTHTLSDAALVSPVDGVASAYGRITSGRLIQAKGKDYTVAELLDETPEEAARWEGGQFLTIYLSPKDYHRIHCPVDGEIHSYSYVAGKLMPVNVAAVTHVEKLFSQNERVTTMLTSKLGEVAVSKIGATFVGSISLAYADVRSNLTQRESFVETLTAPISRGRMEELGAFHMGSTVILLFSPQAPTLRAFEEREYVRVGQSLINK
jgi:phosphatidylserine decarboxylase